MLPHILTSLQKLHNSGYVMKNLQVMKLEMYQQVNIEQFMKQIFFEIEQYQEIDIKDIVNYQESVLKDSGMGDLAKLLESLDLESLMRGIQ